MSLARCCTKVKPASDPNAADYVQTFVLPKTQSVAFVGTRLLMFITYGVSCCAMSFIGAFHATPMAHMKNMLFDAWLNWNSLCVLWLSWAQSLTELDWHLCGSQTQRTFRARGAHVSKFLVT